jgi:transposase
MWTKENRIRDNRDKRRYPSDLIEAEWPFIEPLIPPAKRGGNKRRVNLREIVNGIMYVLLRGANGGPFRKTCRRAARCSPISIYGSMTVPWIACALYEACSEQAGREASPTACIIDSHSSTAAMGRAARLWHHRRWMKPMELPHDPI